MSKTIQIRKGLNINIKGEANKEIYDSEIPKTFAIRPSDFPGLVPKLMMKEGEKVKVGTPIFYDKANEAIKYVSPVSGTLKEIVRGAKRKILALMIESDGQMTQDLINVEGEEKEILLGSGLWPLIKQRPLDKVANPNTEPKSIFVTGLDSSPLAPDFEFLLKGKEKELQKGVEVLKTFTKGKVHVTVEHSNRSGGVFFRINGIELHGISGVHPMGNVGTQIHHIDPINKGETVWTLNAIDLVKIGDLFLNKKVDFSRVIAVTGSEVKKTGYYKVIAGSSLENVVGENVLDDNARVISGNILTGENVGNKGYLGFYHNQITIIPEGDSHRFFIGSKGWLSLGPLAIGRLSNNSIFPTGNPLFRNTIFKNKKFDVDTNTNGEERAFVISGQYEKVFPWDIYPVHLIKAAITNDIDGMEHLGIYEVAPEDFALCEFVCVSKINSQEIIREALEVIEKECM